MLIISEADIRENIEMTEIIKAIEAAFMLQRDGGFLMPSRAHIDFGENTLLLMPCSNDNYFSTKLVTVFPENKTTSLPVTMGSIVLNDIKTGLPLAFINGTIVTALRTGAAGAISTKYLTPNKAVSLGVVGAGKQGYYQVMAIKCIREISGVTVYDRDKASAERFAEKIKSFLPESALITITENSHEVVEKSSVIICTTTSQTPVLPEYTEKLYAGKHIIAVGSFKPNMRELPLSLFSAKPYIFIDTEHSKTESGDIAFPLAEHIIYEPELSLLNTIVGKEPNSRLTEATTIFKTVGIALFDLCAAQTIYEKAKQRNFGVQIDV